MPINPARARWSGTSAATVTLVVALLVTACGSATSATSGSTPVPSVTGPSGSAAGASAAGASADSAPSVSSAAPPVSSGPGVVLSQPWATAELTDVRNGTTFRIADLVASDRVVFIETMAIWCSRCRAQQRDVVTALARLDPSRVTWIGVDVDGSESASDLATYSTTLGFDWAYVVGSKDFLRALNDEFGSQVLSPPSTPIIVVGTDGTVTLTEFGHKSVDRIVELAATHGA